MRKGAAMDEKDMIFYFCVKYKNKIIYFKVVNGVTFKVLEDIEIDLAFKAPEPTGLYKLRKK
jgi:hypothetical protein